MNLMTPYFLLFAFLSSAFAIPLSNIPPYSMKYPYALLTPSYEVLTEDDLAYDTRRRKPVLYNPKGGQSGALFWQCFPVKNVKNKYRTWRGTDGRGPSHLVETLCDLETWAERDGEIHGFFERRALPVTFCRDYVKKWKKLTRAEKFVCFYAENEGERKEKIDGALKAIHAWTWDKFKTRKGCYSYFEGDCDIGSPRFSSK